MPVSGYFLYADTVVGRRLYGDQIKNISLISHASLPRACTDLYNQDMHWRCNFADKVLGAGIKTPLLMLNSAIDSWSAMHIKLGSYSSLDYRNRKVYEDYRACLGNVAVCGNDQVKAVWDFEREFLETLVGNEGRGVDLKLIHYYNYYLFRWSWKIEMKMCIRLRMFNFI